VRACWDQPVGILYWLGFLHEQGVVSKVQCTLCLPGPARFQRPVAVWGSPYQREQSTSALSRFSPRLNDSVCFCHRSLIIEISSSPVEEGKTARISERWITLWPHQVRICVNVISDHVARTDRELSSRELLRLSWEDKHVRSSWSGEKLTRNRAICDPSRGPRTRRTGTRRRESESTNSTSFWRRALDRVAVFRVRFHSRRVSKAVLNDDRWADTSEDKSPGLKWVLYKGASCY